MHAIIVHQTVVHVHSAQCLFKIFIAYSLWRKFFENEMAFCMLTDFYFLAHEEQ